MQTLDRCPACQSALPPTATFCTTCGRILAGSALATIPLSVLAVVPTTAAPLPAGQSLARGRYSIQRPLSRGGMGALYLATDHEAFGRTVVIKALLNYADPAQPREVQAARNRFEREARTLAALAYPTIPQIFSYFEQDGQTYIVMAYIEGRDLLRGLSHTDPDTQLAVAGRAYPLGEVVRWGVALCRTLEYLASRTPPVLHLDIKPANLILSAQSGDLFLVDFGAARGRLHAPAAGPAQTTVFGTPGYAAPEQYQGQSEPRSDVYALAATLYHLVTDDDPSDHAFAFPRLGYLGYLGPILRAALDPAVDQRPTATALREQLEALLLPESRRMLYTPDQQAMLSEAELARWCEQHWASAAEWLRHGLAEQIQFSWIKLGLAADLRRCTQQHPHDPDAALDATIARLDREGFGSAAPALTADQGSLNTSAFAIAPDQPVATGQLLIRNTGRRYVRAVVDLPAWMSTPMPDVALAPGQQVLVPLAAHLRKMPIMPHDVAVRLRATGGADVIVPIRGSMPNSRRSAPPVALLIVVLLWFSFICVIAVLLPLLQALLG